MLRGVAAAAGENGAAAAVVLDSQSGVVGACCFGLELVCMQLHACLDAYGL
jgi:hypothetical protein